MAKFYYKDLEALKLISVKNYPSGLKVLKYKNKVFYDNLWNVDERLIHCRGLVLDAEDNIISRPFKKIFNYQENNTTVQPEAIVRAVQKVNGFMAAGTLHNREILVSTTGTLDSDYAKLAYTEIKPLLDRFWLVPYLKECTFLFEIVHEEDPHIVVEELGVYLIGAVNKCTGEMYSEKFLDAIARHLGVLRPEHKLMTFKDALEEVKTCRHEGFCIRDSQIENTASRYTAADNVLCKLKSPWYLGLKFLARNKKKMKFIFDNPDYSKAILDEEFYSFVEYLTTELTFEEYMLKTEQQKLTFIRSYFRGGEV